MIIEENNKDIWSGKKGITVVIDGDWLAFVGACMTHVNHYIAIVDDVEICAKATETSFNKALKELGYTQSSSEVTIIREKRLIPNWEATAKGVMIGKANKLKRECGAQNILIAIGR